MDTHEMIFFFQAEDGIGDQVQSRGLGDVYKRQEIRSVFDKAGQMFCRTRRRECAGNGEAVSYTHLTLPTNYTV